MGQQDKVQGTALDVAYRARRHHFEVDSGLRDVTEAQQCLDRALAVLAGTADYHWAGRLRSASGLLSEAAQALRVVREIQAQLLRELDGEGQ